METELERGRVEWGSPVKTSCPKGDVVGLDHDVVRRVRIELKYI